MVADAFFFTSHSDNSDHFPSLIDYKL